MGLETKPSKEPGQSSPAKLKKLMKLKGLYKKRANSKKTRTRFTGKRCLKRKAGLETTPGQDKGKGGLETKPDNSKDQANTGTAKKEQDKGLEEGMLLGRWRKMKRMEAESLQLTEQSKTERLQLEELHLQQQKQLLGAFLAEKAAWLEQWEKAKT